MRLTDYIGIACLALLCFLAPIGAGLLVGLVCRLVNLGWRVAWGTL